jgi:transglutaminase-like putative cysteine protease
MYRGARIFHALRIGLLVLVSAHARAAGATDGDPWTSTARYEFVYRVKLADVTPAGGKMALWVPYPAANSAQKVLDVKVDSPWPWRLETEKRFGNRMVYTEGMMGPDVKDVVMTVRVERSPYHGVPASHGAFAGPLSPALYREPDRLVPLSGVIKQIADQESAGHASRDEKIHAFYDYVYRTMTYNKDGTGWGRGDAIWACTNKRGNCTDFHSLLIGMLHSQDIPARFLIGFPVPDGAEGDVAGYHCWAEVYDDKHGWVPVDASEAKKKNLKDAYFGTLPNDRIEFTLGRDLVLAPPQKGEPLNYFIYPYAEIDGTPTELQKAFHFRRLEAGVAS